LPVFVRWNYWRFCKQIQKNFRKLAIKSFNIHISYNNVSMIYSKFIYHSHTTMLVFLITGIFLMGQIAFTPMQQANAAKVYQTLDKISTRGIKGLSTETDRGGHGNEGSSSSHTDSSSVKKGGGGGSGGSGGPANGGNGGTTGNGGNSGNANGGIGGRGGPWGSSNYNPSTGSSFIIIDGLIIPAF
jgi:hypothetical protein